MKNYLRIVKGIFHNEINPFIKFQSTHTLYRIKRSNFCNRNNIPLFQSQSTLSKNVDHKHYTSNNSSSKIFLRNLPYNTSEEDLRNLFQDYGKVTDVFIPWDKIKNQPKTIGYVTFEKEEIAQDLIKKIQIMMNGRAVYILKPEQKRTEESQFRSGSRVILKNLPLTVTKDDIVQCYSSYGEIIDVEMPMSVINKRNNRGYCIIAYKEEQSMRKLLELSTVEFMGSQVTIEKGETMAESVDSKHITKSNQLIVKNVDYEVTDVELFEFFNKNCGNVERIRMPPGTKTPNKGFAFVHFYTKDSLIKGKKLTGTELRGRKIEVRELTMLDPRKNTKHAPTFIKPSGVSMSEIDF